MIRRFASLTLLLTLAWGASTAHASQAAKDLTVAYAKYVLAFRSRDVTPIRDQMIPGWAGVKDGQTISRAQLLDSTQRMMNALKEVKDMCVKLGKIESRGKSLVVNITETADLILTDTQGRNRHVQTSGASRDTWIRTPNGLKFSRSEVLSEKVKVDGAILPPGANLPI